MTTGNIIPLNNGVKRGLGDALAERSPHYSDPARKAIEFLKLLDADGGHNLVAIREIELADGRVDKEVTGQTFKAQDWAGVAAWIDRHEGTANCYFSANEPKPGAPNSKLGAEHIGAIRAIYTDVDPADGMPLDTARLQLAATAETLNAGDTPPTISIDSGGGVQFVWLLADKLDPATFKPWAEGQGRGIANLLSGDAVQDIPRILRLPGTTNLPGKKKREKGRVARVAEITHSHPTERYTPARLAKLAPPQTVIDNFEHEPQLIADAAAEIEMSVVEDHSSYDDLPLELRQRFETACRNNSSLRALWNGEPSGLTGPDATSSGWRGSLAKRLASSTDPAFGALDYACLAWVWPKLDGDHDKLDHRQLSRDWGRMAAPDVEHRRQLVADFFEEITGVSKASSSWIDPTCWAGMAPKVREWEVEGWIPRHEVTLLYGDGGIGKTLLAHQYATAAATGRPWLGQNTRPARVMCFFCEDSADELHRRQIDINASLGIEHSDLGNLRLASRKHEENALGVWDAATGSTKLTEAWKQLKADAIVFRADVIIIDTLSDVYVGDEVKRAQVNSFVKQCLGGLAQAINGSVVALGHPSVAGMNSGAGTSGSTGWSNAVRSRLYLRYPDKTATGNVRELEGMKLNYGPKGSLLKLCWKQGAFTAVAGRSPATDAPAGWPASAIPRLDDVVEAAVVQALNACADVPLSPAKTSPYNAPTVLKRRSPDLLQAYSSDEVAAAIDRLERKKIIRHEVIGRSASRHAVKGYVILPDNMSVSPAQTSSAFN